MKTERVKKFPLNERGRDYVVGDLHRQWGKLEAKLDAAEFNPLDDRLFALGDLVDRSPESVHALEWLAKPWFYSLLGNHEQMTIDYVRGIKDPINYGPAGDGAWFLDLTKTEQAAYATVFSALPVIIEVETAGGVVGMVHAEPDGLDWRAFKHRVERGDGAAVLSALWGRARFRRKDQAMVRGIGLIFVGHSVVRAPLMLGNVMYIATGAVHGRELTLAQLNTPASLATVKERESV